MDALYFAGYTLKSKSLIRKTFLAGITITVLSAEQTERTSELHSIIGVLVLQRSSYNPATMNLSICCFSIKKPVAPETETRRCTKEKGVSP